MIYPLNKLIRKFEGRSNSRDVRAERAWRSWFVDIKLQMDVAEGSVREFRNQSLIVVIGNICDQFYFPAKKTKTKAVSPSSPCNSQIDLDFPASANFNARSVSSFSFSNVVQLIRK